MVGTIPADSPIHHARFLVLMKFPREREYQTKYRVCWGPLQTRKDTRRDPNQLEFPIPDKSRYTILQKDTLFVRRPTN